MDYSKLQNGSDIRGVALEGIEGQHVNLTEQASRDIGRGFALWLMEKTGKTPADADFTEALVKAMYEVEVEGLTGTMKWDQEREPNKAAKAMVFQNGVAVLAG